MMQGWLLFKVVWLWAKLPNLVRAFIALLGSSMNHRGASKIIMQGWPPSMMVGPRAMLPTPVGASCVIPFGVEELEWFIFGI